MTAHESNLEYLRLLGARIPPQPVDGSPAECRLWRKLVGNEARRHYLKIEREIAAEEERERGGTGPDAEAEVARWLATLDLSTLGIRDYHSHTSRGAVDRQAKRR